MLITTIKTKIDLRNTVLYEIQFLCPEEGKVVAILQYYSQEKALIDPLSLYEEILERVFAECSYEGDLITCNPFSNDTDIAACLEKIAPIQSDSHKKRSTFAIGSVLKNMAIAQCFQSEIIVNCDMNPNMAKGNSILLQHLFLAENKKKFKELLIQNSEYLAMKAVNGNFDIDAASLEIKSVGSSHPLHSEDSFQSTQQYFGNNKFFLHLVCDFNGEILRNFISKTADKLQFNVVSLTNVLEFIPSAIHEKYFAMMEALCNPNTTLLFGLLFNSKCVSAVGAAAFKYAIRRDIHVRASKIPNVIHFCKFLNIDPLTIINLNFINNAGRSFIKHIYQLIISSSNPKLVCMQIKNSLLKLDPSCFPITEDDIEIDANYNRVIINHALLVTVVRLYAKWLSENSADLVMDRASVSTEKKQAKEACVDRREVGFFREQSEEETTTVPVPSEPALK